MHSASNVYLKEGIRYSGHVICNMHLLQIVCWYMFLCVLCRCYTTKRPSPVLAAPGDDSFCIPTFCVTQELLVQQGRVPNPKSGALPRAP